MKAKSVQMSAQVVELLAYKDSRMVETIYARTRLHKDSYRLAVAENVADPLISHEVRLKIKNKNPQTLNSQGLQASWD